MLQKKPEIGRRVKRLAIILVVGAAALLSVLNAQAQPALLPIGTIQGMGDVSPYLNRFVNFRGVVVGRYEDVNTRGDIYYTLFVQDIPGADDDDPTTSDGIVVFLGRQPRPDIPLGAVVTVGGKVTEFYGLTEIDDKGLVVTIEEPTGPLPPPIFIDPPADMIEMAAYFEALEGMRVAYEDGVIVAGPTHEGCGFAVIAEATAAELPAIRRADGDPVGRVAPVLYPGDRSCDDIPQVKTGDRITGLAGALTYNFDQFKIIFDTPARLAVESAPPPALLELPLAGPAQIIVASINAENYFDTTRDTDEEGEPVLTDDELAARQTKLAHLIADALECPTLIGLQEVEHEALLRELSAALEAPCGFAYQVSHLESPDARGIDNALLIDPHRVRVDAVSLRQVCSPVPTEIDDPSIACAPGEEPLFGRPPLQVDALIDGSSFTLFVNHFKSKRGGEIETGLERIRQAVVLNGLAAELLTADPAARIVALGDFNDTDRSPVLALLADPAQGGVFANALASVPEAARYSYNFGGVSELIDEILVSPSLVGEVAWATVVHVNTDYPVGWRLDTSPERLPFRASDHDVPLVYLGQWPPTPVPEPTARATPATQQQATAIAPTPEVVSTKIATPSPSPAATHEATVTIELPADVTSSHPSVWLLVPIGAAVLLLLALWYRARR